ncbi:hypothetical protein KOW79_011711 [Hemibagrus wyckioides]|uniref:Uncharacterized protein n=1 Tax=Hemibagrus wyckioides TaxID=337641 RepID=A0A9D3NQR6_9TELE|nr:hypothetical protein KOW79_011711 [Hemibagrus wyckioides]
MGVTRLPVFAVLLAVISHSFGSPVAHEYPRDTGVVLMQADNPDPVFHTLIHHPDDWKSQGALRDIPPFHLISFASPHLVCAGVHGGFLG